jgi:starch-binding outer membrane protein, SusD/RagB family
MTRILNKFSFLALGGTLLFASCQKSFLQKSPFDSQLSDQALATPADLKVALNGAYSALRSYTLFGRDLPVIGDLQADNTFVETKNSGRYLTQYNYSVVVNDAVVGEIWNQGYLTILRANRILETKLTGSDVDQTKAEAYAIRALVYFKLVNYYAKPYTDDPNALGVPIVLKYDPFLYPSRSTVKDVYTQILSDLKAAFQTAPAYVNSVHFSKYAIEALLAKVYLYMGDNTNALAAAKDVISNGGFTLVSPANLASFWGNPAIHSDKVEVMFEIDSDVINNNGFDDLGGIFFNGYQDIYCSSQLAALYSSTDARKSLIQPGNTKSGAAATLIVKFPNAQNPDKDNIKVIRLADVYLIAAEASLPADETGAKTYLNALMAQRDPAFAGYSSAGAQLFNLTSTA